MKTLTIDTREKSLALVAALQQLGYDTRVSALAIGDIAWDTESGQRWVVERKTPADLIASVTDDRLGSFVRRALAAPIQAVLMVEGYKPAVVPGVRPWTFEQLDNACLSVQRAGVPVVHSAGPTYTAVRVHSLYVYSQVQTHNMVWGVKAARPEQAVFDDAERAQIAFLMGIPGIGEHLAGELRKLGSPADVVGQLSCLLPLEGIARLGPKTFERARRFLVEGAL